MFATKVDAALAAVAQGFAVFPIVENTKVARIQNWPNLATTNEKQIRKWWEQHPNDNIGGLTSDKAVIDVDPRNGGKATFEMLMMIEDFPKTAVNATQGDGNHIVYQLPPHTHVKGGTNKLGAGVDLKSWGGYILLPGSTIGDKAYSQCNKNPIALAPAWLIAKGKAAKQKTDTAGKRLIEEDDRARELAEQWLERSAPKAQHGEIDDTTYKVAARLYDFGCGLDTVLDLMTEWNETHCEPPQEFDRLSTVCESAGRNRENAIGSKHDMAPGFEAVEIDERKAPAAIGIPITKPTDGMRLEGYYEAAAKALSEQAEPLIKGILDRAAMSIVYGESNTGKTFVAVDMGFHIAATLTWAGRKTRPGCVVYVAAEGGVGVYKRLAALRKHYPDIPDVPFFIIKFPVDLLHGPAHAKELVRLCREAAERSGHVLELIVIDTLSRAMSGGDENSSTDMGVMVKGFDILREATGAHLMVIHHSGKDKARGARGHSLLRAATDTEIEIERGKITVTKQRDMEGDFKQAFMLHNVNIGRDADGAHVTSCIVKLIAGNDAEGVAVAPTLAEERVLKLVTRMLDGDKEKVFRWEDVSEFMSEIGSDKGAKRSTLVGHLSALSDKGLLHKGNENQYLIV